MADVKVIDDADLEGVIKNPNRGKQPSLAEQQEPNYVRLDKEPIMMGKRVVPPTKKPPAQPTQPQETVSMVDDQIVDEDGNVTESKQGHWIDNNDIVFPEATPFVKQNPAKEKRRARFDNIVVEAVKHTDEKQSSSHEEYEAPILGQPRVGEYILMVYGKIIDTGSLRQIEGVVQAILYGENEQFIGQSVQAEDIVVLKRVNVQVGIFVDRE